MIVVNNWVATRSAILTDLYRENVATREWVTEGESHTAYPMGHMFDLNRVMDLAVVLSEDTGKDLNDTVSDLKSKIDGAMWRYQNIEDSMMNRYGVVVIGETHSYPLHHGWGKSRVMGTLYEFKGLNDCEYFHNTLEYEQKLIDQMFERERYERDKRYLWTPRDCEEGGGWAKSPEGEGYKQQLERRRVSDTRWRGLRGKLRVEARVR